MALEAIRTETEALARTLAQRTGTSVDSILSSALVEKQAALDRGNDIEADLRRFRAWLTTLPPVPEWPTMEEIDDDMYDIRGLPR